MNVMDKAKVFMLGALTVLLLINLGMGGSEKVGKGGRYHLVTNISTRAVRVIDTETGEVKIVKEYHDTDPEDGQWGITFDEMWPYPLDNETREKNWAWVDKVEKKTDE